MNTSEKKKHTCLLKHKQCVLSSPVLWKSTQDSTAKQAGGTCSNPSIWETEVKGLQVQSQSELYTEYVGSLGHLEKSLHSLLHLQIKNIKGLNAVAQLIASNRISSWLCCLLHKLSQKQWLRVDI